MSLVTQPKIRSQDELIMYLAAGNKVKYLYFWGHTVKKPSDVRKVCFSQWYEAGFDIDDIHYPTAEHYMMAEKARLFKDNQALDKMLKSPHPEDAKKLGRSVIDDQEAIWKKHRFNIVVRGNQAKFSQNDDLKECLFDTGNKVLVEASPNDRIWGIGLEQSSPDAENPARWRGLNLLGFALMEVRDNGV
jgi:ribA/ribD-fused uncharacterized protein